MNSTGKYKKKNGLEIKKLILSVHLPLLIVQILFAFLPTFSKIAFRIFTPESIAFYRIIGSTILFSVIFFTFSREKIKDVKHYFYFAVFAIFGVTANQFLFLKGLSYTTAINASILITTIPVFTLIFALFLKKEKLKIVKSAGVLVALAGVGYLIGFDNFKAAGFIKGNILVILNAMSFAIYLVISKPILKIYKPLTVVTYTFLFASLEIFPLTINDVLSISYADIPIFDFWSPITIVLIGTFTPYLLNIFILKRASSSIVAVYTYLQPLIGSVLAIIILGELLTLKIIIAGILILIGVTIAGFHNLIKFPNFFMAAKISKVEKNER